MKKIVFSDGREIELPEDVQFIDDEQGATDFGDVVAILKEERKRRPNMEGMAWM